MPAIKPVEIRQCREIQLPNKENRRGKDQIFFVFISVVDRHRCDAYPDPYFHSDAESDPDWLKNAADPTPCFIHVRKSDCIENFHFTIPIYNVKFFLSSAAWVSLY